jgi:hypothetical protein
MKLETYHSIISWNEWEKTYRPIRNPLATDPGFWGFMFDTLYNETEAMKLIAESQHNVWTLVDNNPNSVYLDIVSGARYINRMGYFVTEIPWTDEVTVSNDPSYV